MDVGKTCAATAARALCADARNAREDARDADRQKRRSGTNSQGVFRKMSHTPYHSAKILFYFCATNFFRSAFSSLATRKIDASSPPSVATAKGRNSILWTSFKNKPSFRKNTTTFLTFSTGFKQGIMTRRNNIRQKVKFLAHFVPHARITCTSTVFRFLPSLLHLPIQYANKQYITGEGFALFCLHLPSPVPPLYPTPSVKAFWGEAFTLIPLKFKPLQHKGEDVKAKIEKQWMRV